MNQPALITTPLQIPAGLPPELRRSLSGKAVAFDLPRSLRIILRHSEKIKVSDHAEKYRIVTEGAHEGPWRHEYAPHTVKIMDTFGLPWVREVWFCGVEQSGKTNTMLNCICWAIDCDPGNIFYLMPTETTSDKVVGEKIKPTLRKSPRLAQYVSARQDDTTMDRIRLIHGVTLFPAWANSPSSMATFTAKHCFGDEIDKYPEMSGKEADPITLIKKRNRNYKGRYKRFFSSTPAGKFIHKGTLNCHQLWEYRVQCPDCNELIKMDSDHLIIPEGATPEEIERNGCEYSCSCGSIWNDEQREQAIKTGRWICVKGSDNLRPAKVGFHHRSWECLDIPLAEIAAAWIKAKNGGVAEKTAWANGYEAIDYEPDTVGSITEEYLLRFRSDSPRNLVPEETARLALLIDTQQDSFYYQVWSYGYAPGFVMHMVRHGQVHHFYELEGLIITPFEDHSGKPYRISSGLIDSGGTKRAWQKHSRTVEVYEWCSRNRVIMPVKGITGRDGELVSYKTISTYPGTNKPVPGGLTRANLRVDLFKDELQRLLAKEPDDPGALSFHSEIDTSFAKHFTTEIKDENNEWIHNRSKGRNDYFDCANYAVSLREILKLNPDMWKRIASETPRPVPAAKRQLPSWYHNRR